MTPRIVARLGPGGIAPENTFAAAHIAAGLGADIVAIDVRTSRDGVFHLLHDAEVDRTTDGIGRLSDMTAAEIDDLDAGARTGAEFAGEPVPRLARFLAALRGRVDFLIELRDGDAGALGHALRAAGLDRRAMVHLSDPSGASALSTAAPGIAQVVTYAEAGGIAEAREAGARVLRLATGEITAARIGEARRARLDVMVAVRNDAARPLAAAISAGARFLETGRPDAVDAVRRRVALSV